MTIEMVSGEKRLVSENHTKAKDGVPPLTNVRNESNMGAIRSVISLFLAVACLCGCGPTLLKTKGRVVKNGAPFVPGAGEVFRLTFVPIFKEGNPSDLYAAQFNSEDGTFQVAGKDLKGMPPGKYRVWIEYKSRRQSLKGKFDDQNSPYVYDVDAGTRELVIDLDQPPAKQ
jgi:hypothetical protein